MMKPTIYDALKTKLGREPTHAELKADVKRILNDGLIERAGKGTQEKRPAALAAYWTKRRRRRNPKGAPRPRRALSVLYAVRGKERLKYLGKRKFAPTGRPFLFASIADAELCAWALKEAFPGVLGKYRLQVVTQ